MPYLDTRGEEMDDMSFSEALERLHTLASGNLPGEHDIARDERLAAERSWQQQAVDTVHDLVVNLSDEIDEAFQPPPEYGEWPTAATQPDRKDDPTETISAIRIVLQMARNAMPDSLTVRGVDAAEKFDLDNQALELTEALVMLHAEELDAKIRIVRMPGV